jgi:hypothetical protein
MCFDAFAHASRPPGKKIFFNVWSGRKRVLMHFRMLPDHQKHGLGWLKTCFDAFAHASRSPGKKILFNVWSGRKRVLMHFRMLPDHRNKKYFLTSGVVKNVF